MVHASCMSVAISWDLFRDAAFLVQVMSPQRANYFVCIYLAPGNYEVLL